MVLMSFVNSPIVQLPLLGDTKRPSLHCPLDARLLMLANRPAATLFLAGFPARFLARFPGRLEVQWGTRRGTSASFGVGAASKERQDSYPKHLILCRQPNDTSSTAGP